jgi:hypothetical protein
MPHGPRRGLGRRLNLHPHPLCAEKERKARRREGDKCFFSRIFLITRIFKVLADAVSRPADVSNPIDRYTVYAYSISIG